jgi:ribonuclease HI
MDAELFAIYKALQYIKTKDLRDRDIYIFVDSQAAIKCL